METEMNKQYEGLVNMLQAALDKGISEDAGVLVINVIRALRQLGQRPILKEGPKQFIDITTNMAKVYTAKNHDYGNSFDQSLDKFGLIASIIRMSDKINRLESLTKKEAQVKNESIKDTLLDLANYAIMTIMWLNNKNK